MIKYTIRRYDGSEISLTLEDIKFGLKTGELDEDDNVWVTKHKVWQPVLEVFSDSSFQSSDREESDDEEVECDAEDEQERKGSGWGKFSTVIGVLSWMVVGALFLGINEQHTYGGVPIEEVLAPLMPFYMLVLLPASLLGVLCGIIGAQKGRTIGSSWFGMIANGIIATPAVWALALLVIDTVQEAGSQNVPELKAMVSDPPKLRD